MMEAVKKSRAVARSAFSRACRQLEAELAAEQPDSAEVQVSLNMLNQKAEVLAAEEQKFMEAMLKSAAELAEIDEDAKGAEEYTRRWLKLQQAAERQLRIDRCRSASGSIASDGSSRSRRRFRLPKLELMRFNGDIDRWLSFWSSFAQIHEDDSIAPEDKFQYLIQCMEENSRAREVVESFPPTAGNYAKVIESLKSRFGRTELLVEVYIRKMLSLILRNAVCAEPLKLSSLYDKLESYMRALETLGVTTESHVATILPLVESCLPEELLRAWQRTNRGQSSSVGCDALSERLKHLMEFLRREVEGEDRIALAMTGFNLNGQRPVSDDSKLKRPARRGAPRLPSSACLFSREPSNRKCAFCSGEHDSKACPRIGRLSVAERKRALRRRKLCFACFAPGHLARECAAIVTCFRCEERHPTLLCPKTIDGSRETEAKDGDQNHVLANASRGGVLLQTITVRLVGARSRVVRALIDTGSQRSYLTRFAAAKAGCLPVGRESFAQTLFGGACSGAREHACYDLVLESLDGSYACRLTAYEERKICGQINPVPDGPWMTDLRRMGVALSDTRKYSSDIDVLIGADVAGELYTGRIIRLESGLTAMETRLGWTLMGRSPDLPSLEASAMVVTAMFVQDADVQRLWLLDAIGIEDPGMVKSKREMEEATRLHFLQTVAVGLDGRYTVRLPWRETRERLSDNFECARRRLIAVTKKLQQNGLLSSYHNVFDEWEREGIIEEVRTLSSDGQCHYLPHRPVIKENSPTTKIRPVFDASARQGNCPSLNNCLETGPNLVQLLPSVLLRFRKGRVGAVADIRKAFLQIEIHPEDRDFLRFLWWEDAEAQKLKVYRHNRVVFGASCSPFLLAAVIEHLLERAPESLRRTARRLRTSFYVDNCLASFDSIAEMQHFVAEARQIMSSGGFDLRGWTHNGALADEEEVHVPVLGMWWDRVADTLQLNLENVAEERQEQVTKRSILAGANQLYDPTGVTCPVLLQPKLILRSIWSMRVKWDDPLPKEVALRFQQWLRELKSLESLCIPRWIGIDSGIQSLHVFCDASKDAFAAVVYLRVESSAGVQLQHLSAKSRLSPLKALTIPRLELLAATIGMRLAISVQESWDPERRLPIVFWSDSTTALSWIRRGNDWSVFVSNRVLEIRRFTDVKAWRHVPGDMNPADLPSRGCSVGQLLDSRWWEGPAWLRRPESEWPQDTQTYDEHEVAKELKRHTVLTLSVAVGMPWYCQYFSSYRRVVRLIAWMRRFVANCRRAEGARSDGALDAEELSSAENCLIRLVQREVFPGGEGVSFGSVDGCLNERGILIVKTKIAEGFADAAFRQPMLLPAKHPLVKLLIREEHEKLCHAGVLLTMNKLREKYWILGGRRTVRSVIAGCARCKRFTAGRAEVPPTTLPLDRVREASVFEVVGVDLAGPLLMKNGKKAWIVLFTCAVYRAVHLELIGSLSTEAFVQSMRRFIARRGRPSVVYSDNGTNFVGAREALRKLDWNKVKECGDLEGILWKLIPPAAAWWGGWWERLIRMLKELLRRTLGNALLNYEELFTVLCDCEAVMNSRPLTYVSDGVADLEPLTPSLFLQDVRQVGVADLDSVDAQALSKRARYRRRLMGCLRRRFRSEYLGQLLQRPNRGRTPREVAVGDVVLVGSDTEKRLFWPLARVERLIPGKDGKPRVAVVRTATTQLMRPLQRLYPLEVSSQEPVHRDLQERLRPQVRSTELPVEG